MTELKKPTTYSEQLNILRGRGIIVQDEERCIRILESINYYRMLSFFLQT